MGGRPADIFKFKQFSVDQSGCAMKINTDGVLLGALAKADNTSRILDIGTGTGVIALMLAQRFETATIDAVEIDEVAAKTADKNFKNSPFSNRMQVFASDIEVYFEKNPEMQYNLIVSNPPFFLNALASPGIRKNLARHTDKSFFERLIKGVSKHLNRQGICSMILPVTTANLVKDLLPLHQLFLQKQINIQSFAVDEPHREILVFGKNEPQLVHENFVIYDEPKVYSAAYQEIMRPFFTIFK